MLKNLLIINAYGAKNIGDEAIQSGALESINQVAQANDEVLQVAVHCEDPVAFPKYNYSHLRIKAKFSPYGFAINSRIFLPSSAIKAVKGVCIISLGGLLAVLGKLHRSLLPKSGFFSFIYDIVSADIVLGIGGGYLISKQPLKDIFGIALTTLPICIAQLYQKRIFHLPVSYGPFATQLHNQIVYSALRGSAVIARDPISYQALQSTDVTGQINLHQLPDTATFLHAPESDDFWALTVRDWLPEVEQQKYERQLAMIIDSLWEKSGLSVVLVAMAQHQHEDDDHVIFRRIQARLKHPEACAVFTPLRHQQAQRIFMQAKFAICTRMHAAILALTVGTPFLTIGYGHKGRGFMESINLSRWFVEIGDVKQDSFITMVEDFAREQHLKKLRSEFKKSLALLTNQKPEFLRLLTRTLSAGK